MGTFLGTSSQQQLGHGYVVGHDGYIKGQQAFTVWGVEVQLFQTVLGQKQLYQVQFLVLHRLEQSFITLKLTKESSNSVIFYGKAYVIFRDIPASVKTENKIHFLSLTTIV